MGVGPCKALSLIRKSVRRKSSPEAPCLSRGWRLYKHRGEEKILTLRQFASGSVRAQKYLFLSAVYCSSFPYFARHAVLVLTGIPAQWLSIAWSLWRMRKFTRHSLRSMSKKSHHIAPRFGKAVTWILWSLTFRAFSLQWPSLGKGSMKQCRQSAFDGKIHKRPYSAQALCTKAKSLKASFAVLGVQCSES